MNRINDYIDIRDNIKNSINGSYKKARIIIGNDILNHAFDWIEMQDLYNNRYSKSELEKYVWSNVQVDHKKLGLGSMLYWIILKLLIRWIVDQVFNKLEKGKCDE